MKVLLTGLTGQLGNELVKNIPSGIDLIAPTRKDLDLSDFFACRKFVQVHKPHWIINAGAYTAVDQAEKEVDLARSINSLAPKAFAEVLSEQGGRILQISTDFVFDGCQGYPYETHQKINPLGVYGATKAEGEKVVLENLGNRGQGFVLRTSWIYGPVGRNFCLTMLKLHDLKAKEGKSLKVVSDQIGCPTSTKSLSSVCWRLIHLVENGVPLDSILHWSDGGFASWYDFAILIGVFGEEQGIIPHAAFVEPIRTCDYPTLAKRPSYSLLDISQTTKLLGIENMHWQEALKEVLATIKNQK